ncbi:MAG TPA: radical SAM protein [Acidobacteriota bacterium]|nr:radical SAM protein [Acidobacteriota bacterium]
MRVVLADLKGKGGHVSKDTVAGGYGSRFRGTSATTRIIEILRRIYQNFPSIHTAYLTSIFANAGHEVVLTRDRVVPGDLGLVLSSIVDYRNEMRWAQDFRKACGSPVGFYGTMATHLPGPLSGAADFLIQGEPEQAALRLAAGERFQGAVISQAIGNLDTLPFPQWAETKRKRFSYNASRSLRPTAHIFPVLSSRSCPEFCTYCPHRITASYRARSPQNVLDELEYLCNRFGQVDLIFRDPLFTQQRDRSSAIADGIIRKNLPVHFECETRLDELDEDLLDLLYRAGLRSITFGVESLDPVTLKKVARRYIPQEHQKRILSYCRDKGIRTTGFYVFGFLTDTAESIRATIDFSIELNSSTALYKILTPYPGTPLRKQMESLVSEPDLEKFDGYTPTFRHPNLSHEQLVFLLNSAYAKFYFRPSWGLNFFGLQKHFTKWARQWDAYAMQRHYESDVRAGLTGVQHSPILDAQSLSTSAGD